MAQPLTMYTTTWCAFCRRLKSQLAAEGIEMAEINIEEDPAAADFVMSVNGGYQTVPTVVFPDGSALTNPSAAQVKQRLGELRDAERRHDRNDQQRSRRTQGGQSSRTAAATSDRASRQWPSDAAPRAQRRCTPTGSAGRDGQR